MRLRVVTGVVAAAAALAVVLIGVVGAGAQGSGGGSKSLFAVMTGAKEPDGGDGNGRGSFSGTFDGTELCYGMTVKNIADPVAAHIHRGGSGVAGPVVVPLEHPTDGDPGASSDCVNVSRGLSRAIQRNPANFYVNVHTAAFPDGAVRGQLFGRRR